MAAKLSWGIAIGGWLALTSASFVVLAHYSGTPGQPAPASADWPADSALRRSDARMTLVMLAHPHCPCTQASLSELERLLARTGGAADAFVVFAMAGEAESPLIDRARAIPDLEVVIDRDGRETARFGAATSGHVVLYDRDGALRFSGGITAARGHEGDNQGSDALRQMIMGHESDAPRAHTFGCELFGERR